MIPGNHFIVVVRHPDLSKIARSYFFSANNQRYFQDSLGLSFQLIFQQHAFRTSFQIVQYGFILRQREIVDGIVHGIVILEFT